MKTNELILGLLVGGFAWTMAVAAPAIIQFELTPYEGNRISEAGELARISVQRSGDVSGVTTVGVYTSDGTATAGADYTAQACTLLFDAGETNKTVVVPILDDGVVEEEWEHLVLTLRDVTGDAVLGSWSNSVVAIQDNEMPANLDLGRDLSLDLGAVAAQPDGKIIAVLRESEFGGPGRKLVRLHQDGTLDQKLPVSVDGSIYAITVQSDGKILIGGSFGKANGFARNNLARLNADGSMDLTFAPPADLAPPGGFFSALGLPDATLLTHPRTGGILLIGQQQICLLKTNGCRDPGFLEPRLNGNVFGVAVDQEDRIVIGGDFSEINGGIRHGIARLNADGSLDAGFNPTLSGSVSQLIVQPDGRILVSGFLNIPTQSDSINLVRFNADGSLDENFLGAVANLPSELRLAGKVFLEEGGTILLARRTGSVGTWLVRLRSNGSLERAFATPRVRLHFSPSGRYAVRWMMTEPGKIWVWSGAFASVNGVPARGAMRILFDNPPQTAVAVLPPMLAGEDPTETFENQGTATVAVRRFGDTTAPATVTYGTRDGSAKAGVDYVAQAGTMDFAPLEVEKTFRVPIINDDLSDPDETVQLMITNATGNEVIGSPQVLTIRDDEPARITIDRIELTPEGVLLQLSGGAAGNTYEIQTTMNLNAPSWETMGFQTADSDGRFQFLDSAALDYPKRFYRSATSD